MSDPLAAGPAMDAALCELMGIEPEEWRVLNSNGLIISTTRHQDSAQAVQRSRRGNTVVPVYPALSTTDAGMGQVLDWFNQRKTWGIELRNYCGDWLCSLSDVSTGEPQCYTVVAATRAEAVGRAALKTREQG